MSKNRRRIRADKFKQQVAENVIGPDGLIEVEINAAGDYVALRLPVMLTEDDDYHDRIRSAGKDGTQIALVVLGYHPDRDAQDQLDAWLTAGNTVEDLAVIFAAETTAARERLGNFRYNG